MSSDTRENPEKSACQIIDQRLTRLGWSVLGALPQDANQKLALSQELGIPLALAFLMMLCSVSATDLETPLNFP